MRNTGIATNRKEFREWLRENASAESGCRVEVKRGDPLIREGFTILMQLKKPYASDGPTASIKRLTVYGYSDSLQVSGMTMEDCLGRLS